MAKSSGSFRREVHKYESSRSLASAAATNAAATSSAGSGEASAKGRDRSQVSSLERHGRRRVRRIQQELVTSAASGFAIEMPPSVSSDSAEASGTAATTGGVDGSTESAQSRKTRRGRGAGGRRSAARRTATKERMAGVSNSVLHRRHRLILLTPHTHLTP